MAASAATARLFLVSGRPGVGKTTLIIRVFESLKSSNPNLKVQGFFTREIREGSERVGFEVITLDGRKAPLASSKPISHPESYRWPAVSKYKVDVKSFESLALPELQVNRTLLRMSEKTLVSSSLTKLAEWNCLVNHSLMPSKMFWNQMFQFWLLSLTRDMRVMCP